MSDISERLVVRSPEYGASRHLAAFIAEQPVSDGAVRITLRLRVNAFVDRRTLLERRVLAKLYPLCAISDPYPTYSVSLSYQTDSSVPYFAGALAVEKSITDDCFGLILNGHYEPQCGFVGTVFDMALGCRIARAAARDLLRTIANYVEYASAHNAAARAGKTAGYGRNLEPVLQG